MNEQIESIVVNAPVQKVLVSFTLGGTSWVLKDVAEVVSILTGAVGFIYTVSLLILFWYKVGVIIYRRYKRMKDAKKVTGGDDNVAV